MVSYKRIIVYGLNLCQSSDFDLWTIRSHYFKNSQKKRIDNMRPSENDFLNEVFAKAR